MGVNRVFPPKLIRKIENLIYLSQKRVITDFVSNGLLQIVIDQMFSFFLIFLNFSFLQSLFSLFSDGKQLKQLQGM